MKNIHVVSTTDFRWGKGETFMEAVKNACVTVDTKEYIHSIMYEDDFEIGLMGELRTKPDNLIWTSEPIKNDLFGDLSKGLESETLVEILENLESHDSTQEISDGHYNKIHNLRNYLERYQAHKVGLKKIS